MLLFFWNIKYTVRTAVLACSPDAFCRKLETVLHLLSFSEQKPSTLRPCQFPLKFAILVTTQLSDMKGFINRENSMS